MVIEHPKWEGAACKEHRIQLLAPHSTPQNQPNSSLDKEDSSAELLLPALYLSLKCFHCTHSCVIWMPRSGYGVVLFTGDFQKAGRGMGQVSKEALPLLLINALISHLS